MDLTKIAKAIGVPSLLIIIAWILMSPLPDLYYKSFSGLGLLLCGALILNLLVTIIAFAWSGYRAVNEGLHIPDAAICGLLTGLVSLIAINSIFFVFSGFSRISSGLETMLFHIFGGAILGAIGGFIAQKKGGGSPQLASGRIEKA